MALVVPIAVILVAWSKSWLTLSVYYAGAIGEDAGGFGRCYCWKGSVDCTEWLQGVQSLCSSGLPSRCKLGRMPHAATSQVSGLTWHNRLRAAGITGRLDSHCWCLLWSGLGIEGEILWAGCCPLTLAHRLFGIITRVAHMRQLLLSNWLMTNVTGLFRHFAVLICINLFGMKTSWLCILRAYAHTISQVFPFLGSDAYHGCMMGGEKIGDSWDKQQVVIRQRCAMQYLLYNALSCGRPLLVLTNFTTCGQPIHWQTRSCSWQAASYTGHRHFTYTKFNRQQIW